MNAIQRLNLAAHREGIYIQMALGVLFALLISAAVAVGLSVEQWIHPSYGPV